MQKVIIGLGAGGHAQVLLEILQQTSHDRIVGLLDSNPRNHGTCILGIPVLGDDSQLAALCASGTTHFFVGVGSVKNTAPRRRLCDMGLEFGLQPVDIIHQQAIVSPSAQWEAGIQIMAGAILNADVRLGANVIVNTGAIVEHGCRIGNHVHIATGAMLSGDVTIADGATIKQGINIGANAIVGAGAVVIRDVAPDTMVMGVPATPFNGSNVT